MRIVMFSMPDSASCFDRVMEFPNLGLASLAGNLDPGQEVRIVDLVRRRQDVGRAVREIIHALEPDLAALSCMSFQYATARRVAALVKELRPRCRIVLGGYHPTLMYKEIGDSEDHRLFDFLIRAEGEMVLRDLVRALESGGGDFADIAGLSFRSPGGYTHNRPGELLDLDRLALPQREVRLYREFRFMGRRFDVIESTRGCWMPCSFCSITRMYGRTFRRYPIERVIEDIRRLDGDGVGGVFFADDNMTLDVRRLKALCRAIVEAKLNHLHYLTQASCLGIGKDPEVAEAMREAGFKFVFLGIESGLEKDLKTLKKGNIVEHTERAVSYLRKNRIMVFGGFIIANPEDRAEDVRATYRYARRLQVDFPIVQCLTPYPKTRMREELLRQGLVVNRDDWRLYNGFICNVRTKHLSVRRINWINVTEGIKTYFNPIFVLGSRIWRYNLAASPALLYNNFLFVYSGLRGRLFLSSHRF